MKIKRLVFVGMLVGFPTSVLGALTAITNAGFEDDTVPGVGYTTSAPSGWTLTGGPGGLIDADTLSSSTDPTPDPTDSNQGLYSDGGSFFQVLGATLASNTLYTLTIDVGDRTNLTFPNGTSVGLGTGSTFDADLLVPISSTNPVPDNQAAADDGWVTWTFSYQTGASPLNAGDQLRIDLKSGGRQPLFDNVRLDIVSIPEPSTALFASLAVIGLLGRRR